MPLFDWFKQQSKTNNAQATDDISQVIATTCSFHIFHEEISIHIAQFLLLKDLNNFALVDAYSLKLLYNSGKKSKKVKYELDESSDFERVQKLVWKPLVLYYFPKFGKDQNVKNWKHVLRRRIQHTKLHGSSSFKIDSPSFARTRDDIRFIENCEWIYKCPLNFKNLKQSHHPTISHCKVCNRDVHLVHSMNDFQRNVSQGNCVAFSPGFSLIVDMQSYEMGYISQSLPSTPVPPTVSPGRKPYKIGKEMETNPSLQD